MSSNADNIFLSIIIPAFNESARIEATLRDIGGFLRARAIDAEIIVVDDGSTDGTRALVESLVPHIRGLRLIALGSNQGKGWAVKSGMLAAKGRYRLFMDADNSTTIHHWDLMEPYASGGYDVLIGSRRVPGAVVAVRQRALRSLLGFVFRGLVHLIAPTGVADTQNGFKAFSAPAAASLFSQQKIHSWAFDVEILRRARAQKMRMIEIPVTWVNDGRSKMSTKGMLQMLVDLIKIRLLR